MASPTPNISLGVFGLHSYQNSTPAALSVPYLKPPSPPKLFQLPTRSQPACFLPGNLPFFARELGISRDLNSLSQGLNPGAAPQSSGLPSMAIVSAGNLFANGLNRFGAQHPRKPTLFFFNLGMPMLYFKISI